MMLTGMADWLRADGLRVEEVAGWQTRGRPPEFRPDGWVWHHTAGGPNGRLPSLNTCLYGVAGVPGPLCNLMQSREPDGNDVFVLIAAGTSNHAGSGGWRGLSGNNRVVGLEIEHVGTTHFPDHRAALAQRAAAAILRGLGHDDARMACQHSEWSSAGKIDVATGVNRDAWRAATTGFMRGGGTPQPGPATIRDEDTMLIHNKDTGDVAILQGNHLPQKITSVNDYHDGTWVSLPAGAYEQFFNNQIKLFQAATGT